MESTGGQEMWSQYILLLSSLLSSSFQVKCLSNEGDVDEEPDVTEQSSACAVDAAIVTTSVSAGSTSSTASSSAPECSPPLPTLSFMYYDVDCNGAGES